MSTIGCYSKQVPGKGPDMPVSSQGTGDKGVKGPDGEKAPTRWLALASKTPRPGKGKPEGPKPEQPSDHSTEKLPSGFSTY